MVGVESGVETSIDVNLRQRMFAMSNAGGAHVQWEWKSGVLQLRTTRALCERVPV